MTEKRYFYKINNNGALIIIDKTENILIRDMYRACDLLNSLNDENEQLKSAYGEMEDYLARLEEENEKLKQLNIPINKIKDTIVDCQGRIIGVYYND